MRRPLLYYTLLFIVLATPAAAQYPPEVTVGSRVRLVVPDSLRQMPLAPRQQIVFGTIGAIAGDTLYLTVPNTSGTLGVPRSSVRRLSISRGVPSRFEGALRHGLSVAVAGALALYVENRWGDDDDATFDSDGEAALIGAGIGFGIGAIIGAVSPSERWRRIRLR